MKGEITAFLSLIFVLLVSFTGAIIESASIQVSKNYKRADVSRAMESVFAEYQKEMLENYDLFAVDITYETGEFSYDQLLQHLTYYGAGTVSQEVEAVKHLTDNNGSAFYEQAVSCMENQLGKDLLDNLLSISAQWETEEIQSEEVQQKEQEVTDQLDTILDEEEISLPSEDNPLETVSGLKHSALLDIVVPDQTQLSSKAVTGDRLVSGRTLQTGYGSFQSKQQPMTSRIMFTEYLMQHFHALTDHEEESALAYELEYLIAGKESDQENLEAVVKRLLALRFGPNYLYLLQDAVKQSEAEALALTLSSAFGLPVLTEAVKHALLLAWAFGESIMDVRSLLADKKVALVKSDDTWQLHLSSLLKLGTEEDTSEGADQEGGTGYREYLRMLLYLENKEELCMRGLDLIERNLIQREGFSWFQADYCIVKLRTANTCELRRGITYQFTSMFGYE